MAVPYVSFTCSYLCSCYARYKFWTAFQRGSSPTLSVWGGNTSQYQSNILAASCRHPHLNRDRSVLVDVRGFVIGCMLRNALKWINEMTACKVIDMGHWQTTVRCCESLRPGDSTELHIFGPLTSPMCLFLTWQSTTPCF